MKFLQKITLVGILFSWQAVLPCTLFITNDTDSPVLVVGYKIKEAGKTQLTESVLLRPGKMKPLGNKKHMTQLYIMYPEEPLKFIAKYHVYQSACTPTKEVDLNISDIEKDNLIEVFTVTPVDIYSTEGDPQSCTAH